MAADILLYDAQYIPVGKDQLQHIEMTRDVASRFHAQVGDTFVLPEAKVQQDTKLIPGIDGQKMSKSRDNTLNIFLPQKQLRKQVMKIQTDSTPLEAPKDWSTCNCFAIYALLASESETAAMKANYQGGNYGYGHAKQALFELILTKFEGPRERYNHFMANPQLIDDALKVGALKAKKVADGVLQRVREKLGY